MNNSTSSPAIYDGDNLYKYIEEVNNIPNLSREQEAELFCKYALTGDLNSANSLVRSYLKLVPKIAFSFSNYGISIKDLISEGNIGLMHAVKKYNPDMGFRLSTYAGWWIKSSMREYIIKSWSLVKIGTTSSQKKLFFNLKKLKHKILYGVDGESAEDYITEIADKLSVKKREVIEMDARLNRDSSLNARVSDTNEIEIIDMIPDRYPNQEVMLMNYNDMSYKKALFQEAFGQLSAREQEIIKLRRLMDPGETFEIISKKFNISKERVRQIEKKAMERLKTIIMALIENKYKPELLVQKRE